MGSAAEWHAFLDEFRSFGGRAENVMQRKGSLGMGIFPIDLSKPIDLHVPHELLVHTDNIELKDGCVIIKDDKDMPHGYADWFCRYQERYSWGAEGKENIEIFETGLKELPENVRNKLKYYGIYNPEARLPEEGSTNDDRTLRRFIRTRCINYQGKTVIMPIIDLVNHSPAVKSYDIDENGISISGMHEGEVLVRYNFMDPLRRFLNYGFNQKEPLAFSIRCILQHQNYNVVVQGGQGDRPMKPCEITLKDDRLIVKQPLLGSLRTPKMPRTLFIQACQAVNGVNADELFDQIQQSNTFALIDIINELEDVNSEAASLLRISCLNQIEAQSNYFGIRQDILDGKD